MKHYIPCIMFGKPCMKEDPQGGFVDAITAEREIHERDLTIQELVAHNHVWKPVATVKPPYNKPILVKTTKGHICEAELIKINETEFWHEYGCNRGTIILWTEKF